MLCWVSSAFLSKAFVLDECVHSSGVKHLVQVVQPHPRDYKLDALILL